MRYLGRGIDYRNVLGKVNVVANNKTINLKIEGS